MTSISDKQITLDVSPSGVSAYEKLTWLLGHYDLRIYVTDTAYLDVGRGSMSAAWRLAYIPQGFSGCLGAVGQFCNFSQCQIFAGGEHRNDLPVNITFKKIPVFQNEIATKGVHNLDDPVAAPINIGNAVVISADAKILNGASIGDGAVIAANALVRGRVEPLSICGGLPARHLKYRVGPETAAAISLVRWWDFDIDYMQGNLAQLQRLAVDVNSAHIYRKPSPRFAVRVTTKPDPHNCKAEIWGYVYDDKLRPIDSAPQKVRDYLRQIITPGPYQWASNIWQ